MDCSFGEHYPSMFSKLPNTSTTTIQADKPLQIFPGDEKALQKNRMATKRDDSFRSLSTLNRSNTSINSYRNPAVSFEILKERAYVQGHLYEDQDFPAHYSSIFNHGCPIKEPIIWKRPHELSKKPTFTADGYSKLDVIPGWLGETSLCSAFSCLTLAPNLVARCIPDGQEFDNKYSGIFHFKFWRFGEWIEVIIDDRLPVCSGQPMFSRGKDSNEFWIPLFEKAYAKFNLCYENITGGLLQWSLQDLTGGIMQTFAMQEDERRTQSIIDKCMARSSLIGVSINISNGPKNVNKTRQLPNGLLTGIAYTVTGYAEIPVGEHSAIIIRLRNPVNKLEWNGVWSKSSTLWGNVTDDMKERLGHENLDEGEFWMSYGEFSKIFTLLEVCHLPPECWQQEPKLQHRKKWTAVGAHRQWHSGYNSGGALNTGLLAINNQFYMELQQHSCVLISIMQRYHMLRERTSITCSTCVYKAPRETQTKLPQTHFMQSTFVAMVDMKADRENVGFLILPPGSYVVIPITAQSGMEGRFLLRIYSDQISNVRELDEVDTAELPISIRNLDTETIHVLRHRFLLMCNRYEEIDAMGLQQILSYQEPTTSSFICCSPEPPERSNIQRLFLSLEICKAAITIVDGDMNGRMNWDEFMGLFQKLILWQHIFQKFTIGNGSIMDTYFLRSALKMAGFGVSNKTLEALVLRYAAKDIIPIEGFVNSIIKLHVAHQRYSTSSSKSEVGKKERIKFLQEQYIPEDLYEHSIMEDA